MKKIIYIILFFFSFLLGGGFVWGFYQYNNGLSYAIDKVYDSVLVIENYDSNDDVTYGTGFIFDYNDGVYYVLTSYHVIEDNINVKVVQNNNKRLKAKVYGYDDERDIAILTYKTSDKMPVVEFGKMSKIKKGNSVFTIGSVFVDNSYLLNISNGIVSNVNKKMNLDVDNDKVIDSSTNIIQTNILINEGYSGGPLVDSKGKVIGIMDVKITNFENLNISFAISLDEVNNSINEILNKN